MNIEGPAFVVKRADGSTPTYRMWVLNRVGRHNLKQDVTATLETALNQGFHMFREAGHLEQGLHSMWFPDAEKEKGVAYFATISQLIDVEKRKFKLQTGQLPDQREMQVRMNAPANAADKATSSSSSAKDWTGGESAGRALLAMLKGTPVAANGSNSGGGGGGSVSISSSSGSSASGSLSSRSIHSHHASVGPITSSSTVDPSVAALFSSAAAAAAAASSSTQHHAQAQSASPPTLPPLLQQLMSTASSASTPSAIFTPSKVTPSMSSEASPPPPSSSSSAFRRGGGGDDFLHAPLTLNKDQLKSLLLELVNEDAFVDLLHASYLKNEAKKRAQRVL